MTRRIIIILVSALAILGLMFFLWFWFFSGRGEEMPVGEFGTGADAGRGSQVSDTEGNEQSSLGNEGVDTDFAGDVSLDDSDFDGGSNGPYYENYDDPDTTWIDGSYNPPDEDEGSGSGVAFDPTPINSVDDATLGRPGRINFNENVTEEDLDAAFGIAGVAAGCVAEFLAQKALTAPTTVFNQAVNSFFDWLTGGTVGAEEVYDPTNDQNQQTDNMIQCIVRSLARAAIQTITAQTVNWINSGFDGKPAFVQNFNKFFSNVADQAAGEFIQGSALSFLCSPFQLEVRIAIAASYAQRNVANAQTCTLSGAVNNVEEFLEGNFSEGGWRGLISFTTEPSNNPFGAFMTAQARLNNQILLDTNNAEREISTGGFLARKECVTDADTGEEICKITTHGETIEAALQGVMNNNLESLQLADSIDAILSALHNQLITKTLYEGLSNLSQDGGYGSEWTPAERAATREANEVLQDLRAAVRRAQQYALAQQGNIRDIQGVQASLTALQNCWIGKGNGAEAALAEQKRTSFEAQIAVFNQRIAAANDSIVQIQQLHTELLSANSAASVERVATKLQNRIVAGRIFDQGDITQAQQDRETLQRQMDAEEAATTAALAQCNAS